MSAIITGLGAAQLAGNLLHVTVKPYRAIVGYNGDAPMPAITADCVLEESGHDELVMTDHPVEQGAAITDHAYALPCEIVLTYGWSASGATVSGGTFSSGLSTLIPGAIQSLMPDSGSAGASALKAIYQKLQDLRNNRSLCSIYTGKRYYRNMLLKSLAQTTDRETENALIVRAVFREVIMAATSTVQVSSAANQSSPQLTAAPANMGTVQLTPATNVNPNNLPGIAQTK